MKEGDRKTPTGVFGFTKAFGIKDNPGAKLPYTKLNPYLYWCGDEQWYNTLVDVREIHHECSGEHLISYVPHYNYVLAIDYNPECILERDLQSFCIVREVILIRAAVWQSVRAI